MIIKTVRVHLCDLCGKRAETPADNSFTMSPRLPTEWVALLTFKSETGTKSAESHEFHICPACAAEKVQPLITSFQQQKAAVMQNLGAAQCA